MEHNTAKKCYDIYSYFNNKWNDQKYRIFVNELFFLILFSGDLSATFLGTTMFSTEKISIIHNYIHIFLIAFIVFKFASERFESLFTICFFAVLIIAFVKSYNNTGYWEVLELVLLILGAYDIDYKKILKVYLIVSIPLTFFTIFCSQTGEVTNLIYHQGDRIRESFGFVYPTDFAAHIFFMVIVWIVLRQAKCTYIELGMMLLIVLFLKIKCDTRCSELLIILVVCAILYSKWNNRMFKNASLRLFIDKGFKLVCIFSPLIFATIMAFLCRFYNPDNKIMVMFNSLLSQRLRLGKKTFNNYDIRLFGQYVEMTGNGSTTVKPTDYTFIDCSYINILMRFGLIVFILVIIMLEIIMFKNLNNKYILAAILLVCLGSMIEHHLFEYYYNIFIILPFASFAECRDKSKQ